MPFSDERGAAYVGQRAFEALAGNTANLAVTAADQTLTITQVIPPGGCVAIVTNIGTQTVFVRMDATVATVTNAIPVLANSQVTFGVNFGATPRAIAAASGSTVYLTLGNGG